MSKRRGVLPLRLVFALLGLVGCAHDPPNSPFELVRHARRWDGADVVLDLREVIVLQRDGSRAGSKEVYAYLPGEGLLRLDGVGAELDAFIHHVDDWRVNARVRGRVRREGKGGMSMAVRSIEPPPAIEPIVLRSVAQLRRSRRRFNGAYVEVEGTTRHAFEVSSFAGMWLAYASAPVGRTAGRDQGRARVTGYVFTRGQFGHLGGYREEIVVTKVEAID